MPCESCSHHHSLTSLAVPFPPVLNYAEDDADAETWFNMFVLHQNRDFGRGPKNCIHEHMLPPHLNLVLWGHEHECQVEPVLTTAGNGEWYLSQPGSSVATSLVPGEAREKKVGVLEVYKDQFRLFPHALKTVRPFLIRTCTLEQLDEDDEIGANPSDAMAIIERLLADAVSEMLRAAAPDLAEAARAAAEATASERGGGGASGSGSGSASGSGSGAATPKPMLPLVRLKVFHTGSGSIAIQNHAFGRQFVGRVANHEGESLYFIRHVRTVTSSPANPAAHHMIRFAPPNIFDMSAASRI